MPFSYSLPTPLDYFAALVHSDAHFPLLEAAASIAQDEYPELDLQQVLGEVDQVQARLKRRIPANASPLQRLRQLNQFFFTELGFGGNANNYYDPENSFLHTVLTTRRGIPVSLAVLWLELAHASGLRARGVAFPGHFMVKVVLPNGQVVIDPLTGQSLGREELLERLEPYPYARKLSEDDMPLGLYLQAAMPRDIVARMLRNLKEIFRAQQDWERLLAVQNRLVVLLPQVWQERRDRGLLHADHGDPAQAIADLEAYLAHVPDKTTEQNARETAAIAERLHALRRSVGF